MNKLITILLVLFSIVVINPAQANDFMLGLSLGPAFGFDADFNKQNIKFKPHLNLGMETLYQLSCQNSSFCKELYLEASFDMVFSARYNFGATQVGGNGQTGNFSESVKYYSGGLALRKHFFPDNKLKPVIGLGLGLSYLKLSGLSFTDILGSNLPLNISTSSLNFETTPMFGLCYEISHKLSVDLVAKLHLLVPAMFTNSFLEIPIGIKYHF